MHSLGSSPLSGSWTSNSHSASIPRVRFVHFSPRISTGLLSVAISFGSEFSMSNTPIERWLRTPVMIQENFKRNPQEKGQERLPERKKTASLPLKHSAGWLSLFFLVGHRPLESEILAGAIARLQIVVDESLQNMK
nr:hypothetical protein Iba_chr13aCG8050 [Ipomoea batatas]